MRAAPEVMKTENVTDSPGTTLEYRHSDALCWMLYTMGTAPACGVARRRRRGRRKGRSRGRGLGRGPGSAAIMIGLGRIARVAG